MSQKTITVGTVSVTVRGPSDVVEEARPTLTFWPETPEEFVAILEACGGIDEFLLPNASAITSKAGNGINHAVVIFAPSSEPIPEPSSSPTLERIRDMKAAMTPRLEA